MSNTLKYFLLFLLSTLATQVESKHHHEAKNADTEVPTRCPNEGDECTLRSQCTTVGENSILETCSLKSGGGNGICCPESVQNDETNSESEDAEPEQLDNLDDPDLVSSMIDAKLYMKRLADLEDKIQHNKNIKVASRSAAGGHLRFTEVGEDARNIALQAMELEETTKSLKSRLYNKGSSSEEKFSQTYHDKKVGKNCPQRPSCPSRPSKYRTFDGSCNNLQRPWIGQALSPFQRLLHAHYEDGVDTPRLGCDGDDLPAPRLLSLALSPEEDPAVEEDPEINPLDEKTTALLADFGQFLDHDMTLSPVFTLPGGAGIQCCLFDGSGPQLKQNLHAECLPIKLAADDPHFAEFNQRCMNFVRTMSALPYNCSLGARQQMNAATHYIDGSQVYGNSIEQSNSLRGSGGRLRTGISSQLLPPQVKSKCIVRRERKDNPNFCFLAGDPRVIEAPLQATLQTIFMREHNRVADALAQMHPYWTGTQVYQEARRIVIAELQHITYSEFLLALLGRPFMDFYGLMPLLTGYTKEYIRDLDGSITNEFATAGYRLHTLVVGSLRLLQEGGTFEDLLLRFFFDSPQTLAWPRVGDELLRGQCARAGGAFDTKVTEDLTDYMFQIEDEQGEDTFGLDILSLNINRGRDHGLRSYNAYREYCGLKKAFTFDDLVDDIRPEALIVLRNMYSCVDDIDLFVGGISEINRGESLLGPTFLCIVGDQFSRSKKGDRYFYELGYQPSSFTKEQLQEIRKVSLARIICDTSVSINNIQARVFLQVDDIKNPIVSCDSAAIPRMDLRAWQNEYPEEYRTTYYEKPKPTKEKPKRPY